MRTHKKDTASPCSFASFGVSSKVLSGTSHDASEEVSFCFHHRPDVCNRKQDVSRLKSAPKCDVSKLRGTEESEKNMRAKVEIEAKNVSSSREVQPSKKVEVQISVANCPELKGYIKGLILKMLSCEDVMKTFNLCSYHNPYVAECTEDINDNEFEVDMLVGKNDILTHSVTLGPRPNNEIKDTNVNLHIHVQVE